MSVAISNVLQARALLLPLLLQAVISSLQYNYAHGYFYNVSKARPLSAILATAAAILRDPLPIKCIEAVFLGMLLTQGWSQGELQRLPVGFKSMGPNRQVSATKHQEGWHQQPRLLT